MNFNHHIVVILVSICWKQEIQVQRSRGLCNKYESEKLLGAKSITISSDSSAVWRRGEGEPLCVLSIAKYRNMYTKLDIILHKTENEKNCYF